MPRFYRSLEAGRQLHLKEKKVNRKLTSRLIHIAPDVVKFCAVNLEAACTREHFLREIVPLMDGTTVALIDVGEVRVMKGAAVIHGGGIVLALRLRAGIGFALQLK